MAFGRTGDLPASTRLPSKAELSEAYGVARSNVRRAVHELEGAGHIHARHGSRPSDLPVALVGSGPSCASCRRSKCRPTLPAYFVWTSGLIQRSRKGAFASSHHEADAGGASTAPIIR
ncbi:GntR family transcriptional regulator [Streptomyces virginiae]|uniref:GntR family transcriptional regulator n=1 Tax=Streptomyces virginiae TaxID=1961 RepID=UPI00339F436A